MTGRPYPLAAATLAMALVAVELVAGRSVPLRMPLQELPFRVSGSRGRVEVIDPEYLRRARPDESLNRRYEDGRGGAVVLYVGYYRRQASRGQVQAVCHGECQVIERGLEEIEAAGKTITVNRAVVRQNGVRMAVLYWYQQSKSITADPYRGKIAQARRALFRQRSDGALVRVSAPVESTDYEARERGVTFVRALLPMLSAHFPD